MTRVADVDVTFLEMRAADQLRAGRPLPEGVALQREVPPRAADVAAALYRRVGADWYWLERLPWSRDDWHRAVNRDAVEVWTARIDDDIAGYFELQRDADAVDISYFGLLPGYLDRRIGGPLLACAVRRAWELGGARVTVNTCTLDHPAALPNYLARGFTVRRTQRQRRILPA